MQEREQGPGALFEGGEKSYKMRGRAVCRLHETSAGLR
jgi:hypothetical protein